MGKSSKSDEKFEYLRIWCQSLISATSMLVLINANRCIKQDGASNSRKHCAGKINLNHQTFGFNLQKLI